MRRLAEITAAYWCWSQLLSRMAAEYGDSPAADSQVNKQGTIQVIISKRFLTAAIAVLSVLPGAAFAYVGPGAGISVLGAVWGLIVGVVMAIGIVLFWPIRIMMRKRKAEKEAAANQGADTQPADEAADQADDKTS